MLNKKKIAHLAMGLILIALLISIPIAVAADNVNTAESNETQVKDAEEAALFDAEIYAEQHGVSVDEALLRFELQNIIGDMNAEITEKEADTFAGLWLEHTPEFKVVVLFTQDGEETIKKYLPEELAGITEVRTAELTLVELQELQSEVSSSLREQDIAADLYTDIYENCVVVCIADSDYEKYNDCLAEGKVVTSEKVVVEFHEGLVQAAS